MGITSKQVVKAILEGIQSPDPGMRYSPCSNWIFWAGVHSRAMEILGEKNRDTIEQISICLANLVGEGRIEKEMFRIKDTPHTYKGPYQTYYRLKSNRSNS